MLFRMLFTGTSIGLLCSKLILHMDSPCKDVGDFLGVDYIVHVCIFFFEPPSSCWDGKKIGCGLAAPASPCMPTRMGATCLRKSITRPGMGAMCPRKCLDVCQLACTQFFRLGQPFFSRLSVVRVLLRNSVKQKSDILVLSLPSGLD